MRWPWLPPRRGDVAAVALLVVILIALFIGAAKFGILPNSNIGLGPDWDCTSVGKGSVCMKHIPSSPADKGAPSN